jgi:nitrate reductase NapAB chaperone NapD
MPICSYVVIPEPGAADSVEEALLAIPGCDIARAQNHDVLLLVTETPGLEEEATLRASIEAMPGIQALLLAFGEIDPETDLADPVADLSARGDR